MSVHITTKRRIKDMRRREFEELLTECMLSDVEADIMRRIYIEKQTFAYIGDILGYSESGIKYKHQQILNKISAVID